MKFVDRNGDAAAPDSPDRAIWYSNCGYWTDDWDKLKSIPIGDSLMGGIPCCPICEAPGFIISAFEFLGPSLKDFDIQNPGYEKFLMECKEKCLRDKGGLARAFKKMREDEQRKIK